MDVTTVKITTNSAEQGDIVEMAENVYLVTDCYGDKVQPYALMNFRGKSLYSSFCTLKELNETIRANNGTIFKKELYKLEIVKKEN